MLPLSRLVLALGFSNWESLRRCLSRVREGAGLVTGLSAASGGTERWSFIASSGLGIGVTERVVFELERWELVLLG